MFVSKRTVQTFQPQICSTVELLCRELTHFAKTSETFECSIFFLAWATDSVAKYLENSTYGLLDDVGRRQDWQATVDQVVELTPLVKQFSAIMPFVLKVPGWLMQAVSPKMNLVLLMHKVCFDLLSFPQSAEESFRNPHETGAFDSIKGKIG